MFIKHIGNNKGIGLVEVIAALGISVVVLTSLVTLALFTLRSSLNSKLLLEGTKTVNKELELVRAFRDASNQWYDVAEPTAFLNQIISCSSLANACHMIVGSPLSVNTTGPQTIGVGAESLTVYFIATRTDGTPLQTTDEEVRISVTANWLIGDKAQKTSVYTDLTNWERK